jgi:hypothetical protein
MVVVCMRPAGGNTFLQPGVSLSLPEIASGGGLNAVAAPALQQLLQLLACLAPPLAALAVQLRRCGGQHLDSGILLNTCLP